MAPGAEGRARESIVRYGIGRHASGRIKRLSQSHRGTEKKKMKNSVSPSLRERQFFEQVD